MHGHTRSSYHHCWLVAYYVRTAGTRPSDMPLLIDGLLGFRALDDGACWGVMLLFRTTPFALSAVTGA